jgi:hypothetical protein
MGFTCTPNSRSHCLWALLGRTIERLTSCHQHFGVSNSEVKHSAKPWSLHHTGLYFLQIVYPNLQSSNQGDQSKPWKQRDQSNWDKFQRHAISVYSNTHAFFIAKHRFTEVWHTEALSFARRRRIGSTRTANTKSLRLEKQYMCAWLGHALSATLTAMEDSMN